MTVLSPKNGNSSELMKYSVIWRKYVVKFLLSIILWLLIAGCTKQTWVSNIRSKMEKCKFKDLFSIHVLCDHIFRHFRLCWKYLSKTKLFLYKELVIYIWSWYVSDVQQYQVILYGPVSNSTYIYFYHFYEHKYTTVRAPS